MHIAMDTNGQNVLPCLATVSLSSEHRLTESQFGAKVQDVAGRTCVVVQQTACRVTLHSVINWT
jgi:hypothetical protein